MDRFEIFRTLTAIRDPDLVLAEDFYRKAGVRWMDEPDAALEACTRAADQGLVEAQHVLAKMLWTGLLGHADRPRALELWQRAMDAGYLPAMVALAGLHATPGISEVAVDIDKAIKTLEEAVSRGSATAMSQLGTLYLHGVTVQQDRKRGIELLRSAAQRGDVLAQCELGNSLLESTDEATLREAVAWLTSAAQADVSAAHAALADLYAEGNKGVVRNLARAAYHWSKANELDG